MKRHFKLIVVVLAIISIHCDPEKILNNENKLPEAGQIECDDEDGDFKFEPGTIHKFWINAQDPEGEMLLFEWQTAGGELLGRTNSDTVRWQLPSIGGDSYSISVKIKNNHGEITRSQPITVRSYEKPVVTITSPLKGDYIVQHAQVDVTVNAFHELGIRLIQFFIDDSLMARQEGNNSGEYQFIWNVTQDSTLAEIKATAISKDTGVTGSDSITVNIEGFIIGKPVLNADN